MNATRGVPAHQEISPICAKKAGWQQKLQICRYLGLSRDTYQYSDISPIIGPGQGSMGGPAACSTITSPLLTAMDRLAPGLTFTSPDQRVSYATRAKMFIDDNSNYSNDFQRWLEQPPTPETLRDLIQHDAQTWERLLWTSGGLLKLEKMSLLPYLLGL